MKKNLLILIILTLLIADITTASYHHDGNTYTVEIPSGWSLFSLPVNTEENTAAEIFKTDSTESIKSVLGWDGSHWFQLMENDRLSPYTAYAVRSESDTEITVVASDPQPYPYDSFIYEGFSLFGAVQIPGNDYSLSNIPVSTAVEDLYSAPDGEGFLRVVSPPYGQDSWEYIRDSDSGEEENIEPFKGYWIEMKNGGLISAWYDRNNSPWSDDEIPGWDYWNFTVMDYLETVNKDHAMSFEEYHAKIIDFLKVNKVSRYIIYVTDPSFHGFEYYDPDNVPVPGSTESFVSFLNTTAHEAPQTEIELMIESDSFAESGSLPEGYPPLPAHWYTLPNALEWFSNIANNPGLKSSAVKGITIDPDQDNAAGKRQVIDYVDYYKYDNNLTAFRTGMALGIDEKSTTMWGIRRLTEIPDYRDGDSSPKLQTAYLEAYYYPSFYYWMQDETGPRDPLQAAVYFHRAMKDQSYVPGTGMITCNGGHSPFSVFGEGTDFTNYTQYPDGQTVNLIMRSGEYVPEMSAGSWKVSERTSATEMKMTGAPEVTGPDYHHFIRGEIPLTYTFEPFDEDMVSRVQIMFSFEYPNGNHFFGNWEKDDFLEFMYYLKEEDKKDPIFHTADGSGIEFPDNYAIFDTYFLNEAWGGIIT
ncbi:hypothetical protein [Methanoplanus endosymbiosus]|uniref:Uncharacterized protein n=1 Tax=Methanoplanus endosymbiosus TaxID=33865 RepID=A0A9E7PN94_9EURY|nr:hypothetical protein [Methanoplanus endosymbiosus]UUX93368.1 hypothetical protein L6E24_04370 [Methanoplanus endosymbiosus]